MIVSVLVPIIIHTNIDDTVDTRVAHNIAGSCSKVAAMPFVVGCIETGTDIYASRDEMSCIVVLARARVWAM